MARRQPPQTVRNRPKPWEPSPQQLEIYALVIEGELTQTEIAKRFGLAQSTVSETCRRIDRWFIPQYMDHVREEKARQTEHLWHIFREAMTAWRMSKHDSEIRTVVSERVEVQGADGKTEVQPIRSTIVTRGQCGNPAFLSQARAALTDIRTIWGVDALIAMRHSGEIRVGGLNREEVIRARIAQLEEMLAASPN